MNTIRPACSNKPRPRVQRGAKGHAGWNRDVYHALKSGMTTYCGIDASGGLRHAHAKPTRKRSRAFSTKPACRGPL